ncbi:MAG: hypothetical protein ACOC5F_06280 [Candidatus Aminicenantaceae bacterium]
MKVKKWRFWWYTSNGINNNEESIDVYFDLLPQIAIQINCEKKDADKHFEIQICWLNFGLYLHWANFDKFFI